MRRAAVTGLVALVLLCGVLLFVLRLRDARLTLGAVLARFGVLVGMESEDVTFRSGDVSLSGTIVFPEQSQPTASVVLVHGSGRVPRMLWLARLFASEGLAVLTYDKRGVGKSGGQFQGGSSAAGASNLDLLAQDREYPGYGHELVVFDFSTIGLSQAFKDSVEWISNIRAPVPGASTAVPSQPRWSAVGVMLRTP
jgi:hypothetical protein